MKRRRRLSSNVAEVVVFTRLLGGGSLCLQTLHRPAVGGHRVHARSHCRNDRGRGGDGGGGRVCTSRRTGFSLNAASAVPRPVTIATPFHGLVRRPARPAPLQLSREATTADDNGGTGGDNPRTSGTDQQGCTGGGRHEPSAVDIEAMGGSPEFISLVNAQFGILSTALGVDRVVLFVRRENPETGTLEFVHAMEYPRRSPPPPPPPRARGTHSPEGVAVYPGSSELLLLDAAGRTMEADGWDTPGAQEGGDGGLSAPVLHASLLLGMITVFKKGAESLPKWEGEGHGREGALQDGLDGNNTGRRGGVQGAEAVSAGETLTTEGGHTEAPAAAGGAAAADAAAAAAAAAATSAATSTTTATSTANSSAGAVWDERDKMLLENVASSVAMAAVLDQKQRWAAVMQVEPLRRVVAESLHQVKNPMTALRTFGKLLLRRLPQDDTLNRELARDIMLQSDRLVDILLPVDAVLGLLATAVEREREALATPGMVDPYLAQREGFGATAAATAAAGAAEAATVSQVIAAADQVVVGELRGDVDTFGSNSQGGVQDALLSPSAQVAAVEESLALEERMSFGLISVEDVIRPVSSAAQAAAKERRVGFRWRVDNSLPRVIGDERALEEALSNVVDNALKFCNMGRGEGGRDGEARAIVVLSARLSTEEEWGADSGVVIEVVDNGPGIDAKDLPYVFDRGYRGRRALQCGIPGTGLGLGIARERMRSFGGDLEVANKDDDGGGWGTGVKLYLPRDQRILDENEE